MSSTVDLESSASEWIAAVLGESLPFPTLAASLKDGVILCRLINSLKVGIVPRFSATPSNASKRMENVTLFIRAARELGMREHELFSTVDLVEEKDMRAVVISLTALGRLCATAKWVVPGTPSLSARGILSPSRKDSGGAAATTALPASVSTTAADAPTPSTTALPIPAPTLERLHGGAELLSAAILLGNDAICDSQLAAALDAVDTLSTLSERFLFPQTPTSAQLRIPGARSLYLCGNSLGLQPKSARAAIGAELDKWATHGVEGHFTALPNSPPWLEAGETARGATARLVGASCEEEVVVMNALTVNLHALLLAFYRPNGKRVKILYEAGAFPSDAHAILSQVLIHGLDPATVAVRLSPRDGESLLREEDILTAINEAGDTLALVMLPGIQYYTGQAFRIREITAAAHSVGALAGWDLAHAVGNLSLSLHDDNVDFAAWCTYKYLNSGPGGIGGAFVHSRFSSEDLMARPRLAGWWGARASDRFLMSETYIPEKGAAGFALSNPPVLLVATLKASLDIFDDAGGMKACREKSLILTRYLEALINSRLPNLSIITPRDATARGAQLSITFPPASMTNGKTLKSIHDRLSQEGVYVDTREVRIYISSFISIWGRGYYTHHFLTSTPPPLPSFLSIAICHAYCTCAALQ